MTVNISEVVQRIGRDLANNTYTLGELVTFADREGLSLSRLVVAEAMAKEDKAYEEILSSVMAEFKHNLAALEVGLTRGRSFLLGTVGSDLASFGDRAVIDDSLINRAVVNTLATEVGNHEIGLRPCAGTGDSCPYTGLIKALQQEGFTEEQVGLAAALILKVGSIFRAGKRTTGCNMEGLGAGAAGTAAALTDLRGGTPQQVARAIVLALSPTIGVPCTPRVMVSGLCATHIGSAILIGHLASNLILRTSLPLDVDVDVMIAMAAKVHTQAAPVITAINLAYMEPYFRKNPDLERFVNEDIRKMETEEASRIRQQAREEVRALLAGSHPLSQVLGDVVVGGSSIAVGSPTNMARIGHFLISGKITKITVDLTTDLFVRRAINMPAILMAALRGAKTDDVEMYRKVLTLPEIKSVEVEVNKVDVPEVQRIRIEATETGSWIDARNRGGGRVAIVAAEPSREAALEVAAKLGIQVVD